MLLISKNNWQFLLSLLKCKYFGPVLTFASPEQEYKQRTQPSASPHSLPKPGSIRKIRSLVRVWRPQLHLSPTGSSLPLAPSPKTDSERDLCKARKQVRGIFGAENFWLPGTNIMGLGCGGYREGHGLQLGMSLWERCGGRRVSQGSGKNAAQGRVLVVQV